MSGDLQEFLSIGLGPAWACVGRTHSCVDFVRESCPHMYQGTTSPSSLELRDHVGVSEPEPSKQGSWEDRIMLEVSGVFHSYHSHSSHSALVIEVAAFPKVPRVTPLPPHRGLCVSEGCRSPSFVLKMGLHI